MFKEKFYNKKTITVLVAAIVILTALIVLTATGAAKNTGDGTIWALLPPIIAISLALITKEVFSSLFIGILSGAILAANFAPLGIADVVIGSVSAEADEVVYKGLIGAVAGTAGIFIFLVELGF